MKTRITKEKFLWFVKECRIENTVFKRKDKNVFAVWTGVQPRGILAGMLDIAGYDSSDILIDAHPGSLDLNDFEQIN